MVSEEIYTNIVSYRITNTNGNFKDYFNFDPVGTNGKIVLLPEVFQGTLNSIQTPSDITSFNFLVNPLDLSSTPINNTLFFNITNPVIPYNPILRLNIYDHKPNKNLYTTGKDQFIGKWDENNKMYRIDFTLPKGLIKRTIDYNLYFYPNSFPSDLLQQTIGSNCLLSVNSTSGYTLPPSIGSIENLNFNSSNRTISLMVTVINGEISTGELVFKSTSDHLGYKVTIKSMANLVYIELPPATQCRNQTYLLKEATLVSTSGHISSTDTDISLINPLLNFTYSGFILSDCIAVTTQPPILNSFNMVYQNYISTFTIAVDNTVACGIKLSNLPIIYLQSFYFGILHPFQTTVVSSNSSILLLSAEVPIPDDFLYYKDIMFSIFGLYDNCQNFAGFPSNFLEITFGSSLITIPYPYTTTPVISSTSGLTNAGGIMTLYGKRFGTDISKLTLSINYNDDRGFKTIPNDYIILYTGQIIIFNGVESNHQDPIDIVLSYGQIDSSISATPTIIPNPTQYCNENTCGTSEQGFCNPFDGCVCYTPYSGYNCQSIPLNNTVDIDPTNPNINITIPDDSNNGSSSGHELMNFIISLANLKEYNFENKLIHTYPLSNWTHEELPVPNIYAYETYRYTTLISQGINNNSSKFNLTVNLDYITENTQTLFANEIIKFSPQTFKYRIDITNYKFSGQLNHLELEMSTEIKFHSKENVCGVLTNPKPSQKKGSLSENINYFTLSVKDKTIYSKFLNKGIIDSRISTIANDIISKDNITFIITKIPHFNSYITLDPDFSILIDSKKSSESPNINDTCNSDSSISNTKSKLSKSQIAGIIVGSILFFAVIVISVIYVIYKNRKTKKFMKKIQNLK